jgi:hypothetical protein
MNIYLADLPSGIVEERCLTLVLIREGAERLNGQGWRGRPVPEDVCTCGVLHDTYGGGNF